MDSLAEIFLDRADNEMLAAASLRRLSEDPLLKREFGLPSGVTFYSAVISHSYYAIFYAAKSALLARGVSTSPPFVHSKTLEAFRRVLVETGILDVQLLRIYREMAVHAEELLGIFAVEKRKRSDFTYTTLPQANREPADESLRNAKRFVTNIARTLR